MSGDKEKIKNLYLSKIKELKKHNKSYYDDSKPKILDSEYDKLKNDILDLENKYKFLKNQLSIKNSWLKPSKIFLKVNIERKCFHYLMLLMKKFNKFRKKNF